MIVGNSRLEQLTLPHIVPIQYPSRYILVLALWLALLLTAAFSPLRAENDESRTGADCVVLLHGLARTSMSMNRMADALQEQGYSVCNIDYPSRQKTIEELAAGAVQEGIDQCRARGAARIHFVTHSLGGILVRVYLAASTIPELGRVVMLAPPNRGSRVADEFSGVPGYELLNGPAGFQLGTDEKSVPRKLGPVDFEVGVIAGDRSINLILSTVFDEPNDGKVAVEDTRLEGMKDFLVVHHSHPFIMQSDEVIGQVVAFLENGSFRKKRN
jgi:pimeloyl-ACP methyl ester carboxylesterase